MNIVIIGLGSMGKRRLRLLKQNFLKHEVYGVDINTDRRLFCEKEYNIEIVPHFQDLLNNVRIDCAFICTSPLSHSKIISKCLENNIHVFTELNLINDGYEKNIILAKNNKVVLFLSSTALYRKETKYIIETVKKDNNPICYNYHVGQYLPDWHPWESYNDFFIGNKKTNGCREILSIELPWIISAFGKVIDVHVITGRLTSLKIDYNDYYMIQFVHENGSKGNLIIDVVCREAVRKLEVFNENIYIEWQGRPDSLKIKNIQTKQLDAIYLYEEIDKLDGYSSTIIENQYLDEIKAFFNEVNGIELPKYSFRDDFYTLELIDRIEGNVI